MKLDTRLKLSYESSPFYSEGVREGAFHVTVGMQTVPITIAEKNGASIIIDCDRPIAYNREDVFLLLDLNAKKMRVMGKAHAEPTWSPN